MAGVVVKYLDGWQKHEARVAAQPPAATGAPVAIGDPTVAVAPVPEPTVSGPNGSPPGAAALSDPDEPEPGAVDKPLELVTDEDVADVPGPPTDEEIAAVSDELKQGSPPARRAA
jgi:hypothetical protein